MSTVNFNELGLKTSIVHFVLSTERIATCRQMWSHRVTSFVPYCSISWMLWSTNWLKFCSYLVPLLYMLTLGTFVQRTLSAYFRRSYYFRLKWTANVPLKIQSLATTSCDSKRQWHIYLCRPDFQRSSIPGGTSTETTIGQLLQSFRFLHSPEPMEIDGSVTGNCKVDLYG